MNPDEIHAKILEHIAELLSAHWQAAEASADEQGRFGLSFAVKVQAGNPVKVRVQSRVTSSVSDSIESSIHNPEPA